MAISIFAQVLAIQFIIDLLLIPWNFIIAKSILYNRNKRKNLYEYGLIVAVAAVMTFMNEACKISHSSDDFVPLYIIAVLFIFVCIYIMHGVLKVVSSLVRFSYKNNLMMIVVLIMQFMTIQIVYTRIPFTIDQIVPKTIERLSMWKLKLISENTKTNEIIDELVDKYGTQYRTPLKMG